MLQSAHAATEEEAIVWSKRMKAVMVHGVGDYRLKEVPVPEIGHEEVLVLVLASGFCAR